MTDPDADYAERLQGHLKPDAMRATLTRAGAFLTIYELVKSSVVEVVASLHESASNEDGPVYTPEYQERFLRHGQNRVQQSLDWLIAEGVLEDSDRTTMGAVRAYRNTLAHELAAALVDPDRPGDPDLVYRLYGVMRKVERFQASLHIDADTQFDDRDTSPDDVYTGVRLVSDLVLDLLAPQPAMCRFPLDERTARQSVVVTSETQTPVLASPDALERFVSGMEVSTKTPDGIASLLTVSRRLLVMASVEYEFAVVAAEKALQAVEASVRHVVAVDGAPRYATLIRRYGHQYPDSPVDQEILDVGRKLRNLAAHPRHAGAMPIAVTAQSVRTSHEIVALLLEHHANTAPST